MLKRNWDGWPSRGQVGVPRFTLENNRACMDWLISKNYSRPPWAATFCPALATAE
jgi:hypothetical protein